MARFLKRYKNIALPAIVLSLLLWGGVTVAEVDLAALAAGIPAGINLLGHMLPPDWEAFPLLMGPALETVQIAFVGTALGAMLSFIISLFAASNLSPNKAIREAARGICSIERALPDLIVILFFVTIVGLGPFPGVMAVAVSSIGMLGKLFADSIEEIDPKPLEALAAVGATKSQIIRYAVLPQVIPSLIANTLFRFDVNIRLSIFLGVVGAGGIGFNLVMSMRLLEYREAMSAIIVILILVVLSEKISDILRRQVAGQEVLR
jgi:phosphonate transport system permease protein